MSIPNEKEKENEKRNDAGRSDAADDYDDRGNIYAGKRGKLFGEQVETYGLAPLPTTSTTVMTAIGDVIVSLLAYSRKFDAEDYKRLHPAAEEEQP